MALFIRRARKIASITAIFFAARSVSFVSRRNYSRDYLRDYFFRKFKIAAFSAAAKAVSIFGFNTGIERVNVIFGNRRFYC